MKKDRLNKFDVVIDIEDAGYGSNLLETDAYLVANINNITTIGSYEVTLVPIGKYLDFSSIDSITSDDIGKISMPIEVELLEYSFLVIGKINPKEYHNVSKLIIEILTLKMGFTQEVIEELTEHQQRDQYHTVRPESGMIYCIDESLWLKSNQELFEHFSGDIFHITAVEDDEASAKIREILEGENFMKQYEIDMMVLDPLSAKDFMDAYRTLDNDTVMSMYGITESELKTIVKSIINKYKSRRFI